MSTEKTSIDAPPLTEEELNEIYNWVLSNTTTFSGRYNPIIET